MLRGHIWIAQLTRLIDVERPGSPTRGRWTVSTGGVDRSWNTTPLKSACAVRTGRPERRSSGTVIGSTVSGSPIQLPRPSSNCSRTLGLTVSPTSGTHSGLPLMSPVFESAGEALGALGAQGRHLILSFPGRLTAILDLVDHRRLPLKCRSKETPSPAFLCCARCASYLPGSWRRRWRRFVRMSSSRTCAFSVGLSASSGLFSPSTSSSARHQRDCVDEEAEACEEAGDCARVPASARSRQRLRRAVADLEPDFVVRDESFQVAFGRSARILSMRALIFVGSLDTLCACAICAALPTACTPLPHCPFLRPSGSNDFSLPVARPVGLE